MPGPVIYSTNVYLKYLIQQTYRGDIHHLWCSEYFDSTKQPGYSMAARVGRSSNPVDIYKQWAEVVKTQDAHDRELIAKKDSLIGLATGWQLAGEITPQVRDEIIFLVQNAGWNYWRPLIYVIPRAAVEPRLQVVNITQRAGFGVEYIISDLKGSEFDVIEV